MGRRRFRRQPCSWALSGALGAAPKTRHLTATGVVVGGKADALQGGVCAQHILPKRRALDGARGGALFGGGVGEPRSVHAHEKTAAAGGDHGTALHALADALELAHRPEPRGQLLAVPLAQRGARALPARNGAAGGAHAGGARTHGRLRREAAQRRHSTTTRRTQ